MGDDTEFSGDFRDGEVNFKSTIIKAFANATPAEVAASELAAAEKRLLTLPLDGIPPVTALPAGSLMPLAPNPLFVGREADLMSLAQALVSGGTAAISQIAAATGLGGIGKTQLAAEFAHRYGSFFLGGVFWLGFADAGAIPGEVARCGAGLGLRDDFEQLPLEQQVQLVAAAWHGPVAASADFRQLRRRSLGGSLAGNHGRLPGADHQPAVRLEPDFGHPAIAAGGVATQRKLGPAVPTPRRPGNRRHGSRRHRR